MPQVGAGKGDGPEGHDDFGRERVTGLIGDRYRFRTPSLRNVALSAPYGHSGAYGSLEAIVRHHLDPVMSLEPQATRRPRLGKSSEASGTRGVERLYCAVERSRLPPKAGAGKRDSLYSYDPAQLTLPHRADLDALDLLITQHPAALAAIASANELDPVQLSEWEFDSLIAFLHALTDLAALDMRTDVPSAVPSGLPLAE